jgi:preprotein translocase subunit SecA
MIQDRRLDNARLRVREQRKTYQWPHSWVHHWNGVYRRRNSIRASLLERAQGIHQLAADWSDKSDDELREIVAGHRLELSRESPSQQALRECLAAAAQASRRVLGLSPYPVQIAGALGLFESVLAEMATGEGKSLTVALAAALQGSTRLPCHVVTSNDYLAERDATQLSGFFGFFGLRSAAVTGEMQAHERASGYNADITYTTPKNIVADFLRDRLQLGLPLDAGRRRLRKLGGVPISDEGIVMRGLHYCIVDEADSVLIDEAVTPLLISSKSQSRDLEEAVSFAAAICGELETERDYTVNYKFKEIQLPPDLITGICKKSDALPAAWRGRDRVEELIRIGLSAREFYHRDVHYIIEDGKIQIVDEFTGRVLPDRTWQEGIHQAVEAKEGLEITPPNETRASLSFQRYFRCYPRLSGLSGTAYESRNELWAIYHLPVIRIPTHRPVIRKQYPSSFCPHRHSKWDTIIKETIRTHETTRPVLIGTRSIDDSEELSRRLDEAGLSHRVLNAVRHREEAAIVAEAGQAGAITIATNMAGRGTDIKLGDGVPASGGLHVIATDIHESARIDRQLIGRAGRQGDPGSAHFVISLEDALLKRFLPAQIRKSLQTLIEPGQGPSQSLLIRKAFTYAQSSSEKMAFRSRKQVLKLDTILDEQLSYSGKSSSV